MAYFDRNNMPTPEYKRDREQLTRTIQKQYKEMLEYLLLELKFNPDDPKTIRQAQIMKQVNKYLNELDSKIGNDVEKLIRKTFKEGQAYQLLTTKQVDSYQEGLDTVTFDKLQRAKVEALVADTHDDILMATNNTSTAIKKVVKEVVRDVTQYKSLNNANYAEQSREIKKRLTQKGLSERIQKEGFVGIKDKAGRKWNLKTYTDMVAKTKTNQAFVEGEREEGRKTGFDLAVISSHGAEDACRKWEGVIISMNGETEGYPTYDEARGTNEIFHPNCEHSIHPIRNKEQLPEEDIQNHNKQMQKVKGWENRQYKRKN